MLHQGTYPDSQNGTHRRPRSVHGMRRLCPYSFTHGGDRSRVIVTGAPKCPPPQDPASLSCIHWRDPPSSMTASDHMTPTAEEVAQAAKASAGSETVKTITDLRFEQLEAKLNARIDELMRINEELRAANKELYAVASAATAAEPATAAVPAPQNQTASSSAAMTAAAVVGQPSAAEIAAAQKAREDALLAGVMSEMGFKPKPAETTATTTVQDGM